MIATKRVRKPEPLPYPRPEGCSEIGAARAKELCGFRLSKYRAEEHENYIDADDMHTLEGVVCELGREISKKRLRPASKNLRNAEYLISLILTSEGHSEAVPEGWEEPRDQEKTSRKRSLTLVQQIKRQVTPHLKLLVHITRLGGVD